MKMFSRITIIIDVNSLNEVEQIIKQLNRQIDVIRVRDITESSSPRARKLFWSRYQHRLLSVQKSWPLSSLSGATVVDVAPSSITIQMTGDAEKSEALLRVIRPYGIRNIARTGATGFTRD